MVGKLIKVNECEKIVKEYVNKKERVTVTDKRLIIENDECAYTISLDVIGAVQFVRKNAAKCYMRIYTKSGNNLFPYMKDYCVLLLNTEQLCEIEQAIASVIYGFDAQE